VVWICGNHELIPCFSEKSGASSEIILNDTCMFLCGKIYSQLRTTIHKWMLWKLFQTPMLSVSRLTAVCISLSVVIICSIFSTE
jgi:hypothetical protein